MLGNHLRWAWTLKDVDRLRRLGLRSILLAITFSVKLCEFRHLVEGSRLLSFKVSPENLSKNSTAASPKASCAVTTSTVHLLRLIVGSAGLCTRSNRPSSVHACGICYAC